MNFREETVRILSKILLCLAVASGLLMVGCSSEVGSAPSTKEKLREVLTKELEKTSGTAKGSKSNKPAPKSIKSKLLNVKEPVD
jgi:hypothetical protein